MSVEMQDYLAAAIPGEDDHVREDWRQPELTPAIAPESRRGS